MHYFEVFISPKKTYLGIYRKSILKIKITPEYIFYCFFCYYKLYYLYLHSERQKTMNLHNHHNKDENHSNKVKPQNINMLLLLIFTVKYLIGIEA
mgnify:FL=1